MDLGLILKVILLRRQLRKRESWHADEVKDFQAKRLGQLREFAYAHSPFYKVFHKNLMSAPLEDLPILTKKILMENFDVLTTDRMMSLQEVRSHIETMTLKSLLHNEYRVTTTAGTTGARGVFVHNKE